VKAVDAKHPQGASAAQGSVLVIEDSKHYQNLVSMLLRQQFPQLGVHIADDGIAGLAMAGQLQPQLLSVDILLPGIDGPTLIMSLRSHPQFAAIRLIVITSLSDAELVPYRFALDNVPVVHKTRLIVELPARLREVLGEPATPHSAA
jgi:CheY-like chemotaxis protein